MIKTLEEKSNPRGMVPIWSRYLEKMAKADNGKLVFNNFVVSVIAFGAPDFVIARVFLYRT